MKASITQASVPGARWGTMPGRMLRPFSLLLLAALAAGACSAFDDTPTCKVGADCASGMCKADGTCVPVAMGGSGGGSSSSSSASSSTSSSSTSASSSTSSTSTSSSSGGNTCVPNDDFVITRKEVPLQAGLHATFQVADGATFDTAGASGGTGERVWDLKVGFSGDHALLLETQAIDPGAWYAADFPGATYQARMSDTNDLLGIFKLTDTELSLLGVVSPMDSVTATKLVYATPIVVLSFPLTEGKTWDTLSAVTGKLQGIPIGGIYNEEYTATVDAKGTLKTPFADFKVLRVHTKLLRFLNGVWMTKQTHGFVTECFGTVGTIISEDNELNTEFTSTAEIWRLSP